MSINPIGASPAVRSMPSSNVSANNALESVSFTQSNYNQQTNTLFSATNISQTGILSQNVIQTLQDFGVDNTSLSIDENTALQHFVLNLYDILTSVDKNTPTDAGLTNTPIDLGNSDNDLVPAESATSDNDLVPVETATSDNDSVPAESATSDNDLVPVETATSNNDLVPAETATSDNDLVPAEPATSDNDSVTAESATSDSDSMPVESATSDSDLVPTEPATSDNNDLATLNDSANSNSINAYNNSNSNLQIIIGEMQKITELNLNFDNLLQTLKINSNSINLIDFLKVLNYNIDNSYSPQNKGYLISVTA
ncbi:MAG: hypothetical protein RLZZ66_2156 [Pseudomonadota bacterium]|jgi:hypothetical protein